MVLDQRFGIGGSVMKYVVNNVYIGVDDSEREIRSKIAKRLSITPESFRYEIVNRSLELQLDGLNYSVRAIVDTNSFIRDTRIGFFGPTDFMVIQPSKLKERPIVIGAGISGLFCAYVLAKAGARPIVFEQGGGFEERIASIGDFEREGSGTPFAYSRGLGGFSGFCGGVAYSDSLNTYEKFACDTFLEMGADKSLSLDGTSFLSAEDIRTYLADLCTRIVAFGGEIHLHSKVTQILSVFGKVTGVRYEDESGKKSVCKSRIVVMATGNLTPGFLPILKDAKIAVERRPFYLGLIAEARNKDVFQAVYHSETRQDNLPMFRFDRDLRTSSGRKAKIYLTAPNGKTVNFSSAPGEILLEGGFPNSKSQNCVASLLLKVSEEDFDRVPGSDPISFLQSFYASFYQPSNPYFAPSEIVKDFLARSEPMRLGRVKPTYKPGVYLGDLASTCPSFLENDLEELATYFSSNFPGAKSGENLLYGFTCGGSSPIGVKVDDDFATSLKGVRAVMPEACSGESILKQAGRGIACAFSVLNQD